MEIHGNLVDIHKREISSSKILIEEGKIATIEPNSHRGRGFILPGFVDAHIHIESSLLTPSEFARMAIRHGTIAAVSDPHEIAAVLGISGVEYMVDNGRKSPFKFYFGAPSSIPTTADETTGAYLSTQQVRELLENPEIKTLSEVKNVSAVIKGDPEILEKIAIAKQLGKRIDGHAPGVFGDDLKKYVAAGIETDHECSTLSEAREKHAQGMKILLRESSIAKDFNTLFPLLLEDPENCMLSSDHLLPHHLMLGHINLLVRRAVQKGMDPLDAITVASRNPVLHYGLEVGLLRIGDRADFIIVENLNSFRVLETYIDGKCVFKESLLLPFIEVPIVNQFQASAKNLKDFAVPAEEKEIHVIEVSDKTFFTKHLTLPPTVENNLVASDPARDILKIAVVNRYKDAPLAIGFVKNFGLKKGALASSIAHDAHNIVAIGTNDKDLCTVVNALIKAKGGIALTSGGQTSLLPLPIAGLMSNLEGEEVAMRYSNLEQTAKNLGCPLQAPFMTLSFMTDLTIPELKISDKGLFDCKSASVISLFG